MPPLAAPFVLFACGHIPTVGTAAVVTSTVIVQVVAGFTICRPATVIVPDPAAAVTDPPVQVPPTFGTAATTRPAGRLSTKLNASVGLPAGCVTVNVSVVVPPIPIEAGLNAFVIAGTAEVTDTQVDPL